MVNHHGMAEATRKYKKEFDCIETEVSLYFKNAQLIWICGIEPSDGLRAGRETLTFEIFNEVTRILILKYAFEYKDLDQHFMTARICKEPYNLIYRGI